MTLASETVPGRPGGRLDAPKEHAMDFELSDDQVALRDAARDLLDGYAAAGDVRTHLDLA